MCHPCSKLRLRRSPGDSEPCTASARCLCLRAPFVRLLLLPEPSLHSASSRFALRSVRPGHSSVSGPGSRPCSFVSRRRPSWAPLLLRTTPILGSRSHVQGICRALVSHVHRFGTGLATPIPPRPFFVNVLRGPSPLSADSLLWVASCPFTRSVRHDPTCPDSSPPCGDLSHQRNHHPETARASTTSLDDRPARRRGLTPRGESGGSAAMLTHRSGHRRLLRARPGGRGLPRLSRSITARGPVPAYGRPLERRSPPSGLTLRDRGLHVNSASSNVHANANAGSWPSGGHRISRADRSSWALDPMSNAECRSESMCPALRAGRTPFGPSFRNVGPSPVTR